MSVERIEIMEGVALNHLRSDKFKTACMSISMLSQLDRETASLNALVPYVLRRGTTLFPDMEQLAIKLEDMYGTIIEPVIRRVGEVQCCGFYASFPEDRYLPDGQGVLAETVKLISDLLISPATRGGLLLQNYVESEKEKMLEVIRSRINDKTSYSLNRCIEEMCCYEAYATGRLGTEDDCRSINYKKLSKHYKNMLQTSPIEIFYCGNESPEKLASLLEEALITLPRGEIDYDIGTDIRMNTVEEGTRYFEEEMNINQGKLVLGFRLGECMEEPDVAALAVFNTIYGGMTNSKLFMNVREKLSLCYYASSILEFHKGLLLAVSGIEPDNYEAARDEILHQLDEIRSGNITDEEIESAKATVISDHVSLSDSQAGLESFYFSQIIDGTDYSPEDIIGATEFVTKEDIAKIASGIECDLIYFLKGSETEDDEDD